MRLLNLQNTYINLNEVIFIRIRSDFQEGNWTGIEFYFNNNSLSFEAKKYRWIK